MKLINSSGINKAKKNLTQKAIRLNQKGLKSLLFGNVEEAINSFKLSIKADYKYPARTCGWW
jgi:outer membrane protein assembly factor BamD (BamD/ComL family)